MAGSAFVLPAASIQKYYVNLQQELINVLLSFITGSAAKSEDSVEGRYVRYVSPDGDGSESKVEYDMDDEDEEWLAQYNRQVSACHFWDVMKCIFLFMLVAHVEQRHQTDLIL